MARIIVKSNNGQHVLMDENGIGREQIDNPEIAIEMLERLSKAIAEADRRVGPRPPRGRALRRLPSRSVRRRGSLPYVRA